MKLFRFGEPGKEQPGVIIGDTKYDVSAFVKDFDEEFFAGNGLDELWELVLNNTATLPLVSDDTRIGPPVKRPGKIICIGLNFRDHAIETNAPIPTEPIVFFKATSAICGPNDNVVIPKNSVKTDWEVELAVVIGKKASYVNESDAHKHIAGYVLHNDYSEREFQLERGGQWVKGKSCDTFAPLGPYLLTPEGVDVDNLKMWLTVNGQIMQNSNTSQLIFKVPFLIHYLSQFMTLHPGDIISTGTPHGVGLGFKPPIYLKPCDVVELGIEGLGSSKQIAVAYKA
ncbi:fumarylacetoacetate hydrolase family protein [Mucilaginibacter boryungensis]|uniref:Fumarylacetoacetate hydrolase family protein n=1 Tax=Mucilaginibacter boryungensis TaxID=768480 RepID=A0ABR9XFY9_9SPHI|nr:fumarylacetoacetate hydrolase family protein [Mucilaginibacter boryungensis]MBE9666146.1 fumarylacetoacetate hydrolase family protein [Mucilaginibacter boryungensis]